MKIPVVLLGLTLAAVSLSAQTAPALPAPAKNAAPEKPKPAAKAAEKQAKKDEPLPKIPGTEIARPDGTFLGLELAGGNFRLSFYDKKKKPVEPNVTRANARWPNRRSGTPSEYRTVLNPNGKSLVGSKPVLPPYGFNVYLNLLRGDGENAEVVESYVVSFKG